jgi:hypothetical protein
MKHLSKQIRLTLCGLALLVLAQTAIAADLNGKWNFVFETPGGEHRLSMTFTQNGESLTATLEETQLKGTCRDGQFQLAGEYYHEPAGYKAELKLTGKLEGDQLKGDATWDAYQATFTATRAE